MMEQIAQLTRHPNYAVLVQEITAARDKFMENFSRGLVSSSNPIDQREVDEKRGFWRGALWALDRFPQMTAKDFEKFIAQTKDGEHAE